MLSKDELLKTYLKELENPVSSNLNKKYEEQKTFGDKLADRLTTFTGSWSFIIFFLFILVCWIILNVFFLINPIDPFPFVLMNLLLSSLAAFQAPIIMMSQNRQAERDRLQSDLDYLVNLKTEARLESLHRKVDALKKEKLGELIELQKKQEKITHDITASPKKG
ncbi:hypothetical protein A2862_03275 [Candidatus Roizmanbacteria bacterium RIFCSPHIGHO2_01_FULL_38_41]|uniref:Cyclic nucleotide-binding protein n=1 Tax=Candidatus Roizmanbacteria bacterium RIFCSPHIGHO2_02_FULL_37_24 TaxID=1802037 RepID=A0A1F7GV29_9BACT|nr:MAG: hypothetical protein A2862_03275 [Candidatus Roizmanbacteria bacterium RIFCSPHIGHO2_01_FULL_38_41]OGK22456.1 MAG: hypothetical protein A3C24_03990 [Candidatus Roizmanbacteria bacterium RIFCSPHIGHO2_02_FULL_37_24]OGK33114.1 MAG: hypothetical protein A3E10_00910 [Candidatus Roizmanbacteria bacterium RIFCSPHIGHO2_12_FULL_37_23]OGK43437.1 MAG: hypothetical protein A2956_02520 [Candidatus Roizmanbacteria bacterium RIFCSPLOWO2_01_FULL_37_57]OGK61427.1 MAG: hypothetical protein A3G65_00225 [Ca